MLKSIEEIKEVEIEAGVVVNGVDNANLMSVDSTEPIETEVETERVSEADIGASEEEKEKKEKEEKEEKKKEKSEEKSEKKEEKQVEEPADSKKVQKRINKLTKKMRTAERENEFNKKRADELEKKLKEYDFEVPGDDKPLKVDFDDEDEYIEALTDWKIEKKLGKTQQIAAKDEQIEAEQDAVKESYGELDNAIDSGKEKYEDFTDLVMDKDLVISSEVTQILLDTEIPEDIMYYLASNPEESERISNLDPLRVAKEIGKIENSLITAEKNEVKKLVKKKVKKQSKAPAPISSVRTDGVTEKDPNKMSPKEYREWRSKQ